VDFVRDGFDVALGRVRLQGGASQLVCAARAKDVVKIVQTLLQRLMVRRRLVGPKRVPCYGKSSVFDPTPILS